MLISYSSCQQRRPFTIIIFTFLMLLSPEVEGQIGIGVNPPDPSAMLHVQDTAKGMLIPRMTAAQKTAINNPAEGLMIYQTNERKGFWYFIDGAWMPVSNGGKSAIVLKGDITNSEAQARIAAEAGPSTQVIKIVDCSNLTSLDLSGVSGGITQLWLQNNPQLQNISLNNISSIEDTLLVSNCPLLNALSLPSVERMGCQLRMVNTNLASLTMPNLKKVAGNIVITGNGNLTALSLPLFNNTNTNYSFTVQNNNRLTSLSMPALTKAASINVSNNRKLSTVDFDAFVSTPGNILFDQDSSLTAISFPSCTTIGPDQGTLSASFDSSLTSISMPLLSSIRSFNIHMNRNLQNFSMPVLSSCSGVTLGYSKLSSFSLPLLTTVEYFVVQGNSLLTSIDLSGLTTLGNQNGMQSVFNNPLLTTITWPGLTSIRANLTYMFASNKLPSSEVNNILAKIVEVHPINCNISLNQTVAAPPTGQGITDKATLIGWNNTVITD